MPALYEGFLLIMLQGSFEAEIRDHLASSLTRESAHEAAAVYMADLRSLRTAYRTRTVTGVGALVTAGAGAANAIGPLFTASESETPVLLLTGDSPLAQDGAGAFQEFDQVPMTAPATKHSFRATRADSLGDDIAGH